MNNSVVIASLSWPWPCKANLFSLTFWKSLWIPEHKIVYSLATIHLNIRAHRGPDLIYVLCFLVHSSFALKCVLLILDRLTGWSSFLYKINLSLSLMVYLLLVIYLIIHIHSDSLLMKQQLTLKTIFKMLIYLFCISWERQKFITKMPRKKMSINQSTLGSIHYNLLIIWSL